MLKLTAHKGSFGIRIAMVVGLVFATVLATTPAQAYVAVTRGTYIVQVKPGTADSVRSLISKLGETPHDELTEVLDGFVLDLTDAEVSALRGDANVIQVVADQPMSLLDTQSPTPSWGLDRIDQNTTTYDSTYNYATSAGEGVRVYIVDTGVMASDPDFAGRIETGADMFGQNLQGADCQGHGTHVAGTVAGTKFGVAKKATIVPIRVLGCSGSGSWSLFMSAMDWIIANHPAGTPGVMNASLGGGKYQLVNDAVQKLYAAGITPVIAAGNSNADACAYSPASTPNAITVGASDINDTRASFSNFGDCVDVFAPGQAIVSNNFSDSTTPRTLSGTSMAAPHVAGLAALYLGDNQTAAPAAVTAAIQAGAQAGQIVDAKSASGNYLINTKFTNAALPPVGAPTVVTASAITANSATISWAAPAGTQAASGYKVEYRESTSTNWLTVESATTTATLTLLKANTTYTVRVLSTSGAATSVASSELVFSTLAGVPDAPANLRLTATYGSQLSIAWDAPLNANGSKVAAYEVWMDVAGTWTQKVTAYTTVANVTALTPGTSYSLRVVARNTIGSSEPSNVLTASTSAATPGVVIFSSLTAVTARSANISWRAVAQIDSATPITYRVVASVSSTGVPVATYTTSALNQTITGLTRSSYYRIVVTAFSGTLAGPPSSTYTFRTSADVPTAPTNVSVQKTSPTEFNIVWQPPRDSGGVAVTGYKVEKFVAGVWTLISSPPVTVNNQLVPAPAAGVSEQYRVSAVNAIGTGASANVNVTGTVLAPQAPTNLALAATSSTSGTLTWVAPTNTGGAPVSAYGVRRSTDGGTTWSVLTNSISSTARSFVTILPPKGLTYTFTVVAFNSGGSSPNATPVSFSVQSTVPATMSAPSTSWASDGSLAVSWRAPSDTGGSEISAYKLQRLVNNEFTTVREGLFLKTTLLRDAPGATYTLRVMAVNSLGEGLPSPSRTVAVPFAKSSSPQNLVADTTSQNNRLVLSWTAPENTGGAVISRYYVQYSKNSSSWYGMAYSSSTTVTVGMPPKGSTYSYRVLALTSAGYGEPSNVVTVTSSATKSNSPYVRSLKFDSDGAVLLTWYAPGDNGGSPITGYRVETSANGQSYTELATTAANVLSATAARPAPGVRAYFRVFAITALGDSNASSVASIQAPFLMAKAPQNFTATESGSGVATSWQAPADLGGSTYVTYRVQVSKDNGATWSTASSTSALSVNVVRPNRGATWAYRVVAYTSFGLGEPSSSVSISVSATAPLAPSWSRVAFAADGSIELRWLTPSDNGGSPITSYAIEKSYDRNAFTVIASPAFGTNTISIARENPGVRIYLRVAATSALGTSPYSYVASLQMPYLRATAPQAVAIEDKQSYVRASWSVPANLGGSSYLIYHVDYSRDNGATWSRMTSVSSTSANLTRPTKGTTWLYRITTYTSYGLGDSAAPISVSAPTTVPSAPSIRSFVFNADQSMTLTFNGPSDLGGVALSGYRVEKSISGSAWSELAALPSTGGPFNIEKQPAGTRLTIRVLALNSVGASAPSGTATLQTPYVQATAPQGLTATPGSSVALRWSAPTNLGGSTSVSYYQLQYSIDGNNWINYTYTSSLAYNLPSPPKGVTYSYRVLARTNFGLGMPSEVVTASGITTAPSSVTGVSLVRTSETSFTLGFNRPSDLGGLADWTYRVEQRQGNAYVAFAAAAGASTNSVQLAAPARNVYVYYRIVASNAKGDSYAYTIAVRG